MGIPGEGGRPAALAAVLAVLLYLNALPGPFIGDDIAEIDLNPRVQTLANVPGFFVADFWGNQQGKNPLYRPITATVATTLYVAGGGKPLLFHAWNLLLHAAASAMAALVVMALGFGAAAALIAGLLFAAHPVHTEAVAWISGHGEILAALFVLSAWWLHARARHAFAVILFGLALLTKESAIVFPALALAGDRLAPAPRRSWKPILVYGAVAIVYLGVRYAVLGHVFGGGGQAHARELLNPLVEEGAWTRVLTSFKVMAVALRQIVFPAVLCYDYGFNQLPVVRGLADPDLWISLLSLAAVAGAVLAGGALRRGAALAALIFGLTFLPTSNLFFPGIAILAERNLYLPALGSCLAAALLLSRPKWGAAVAVAAIAVLCARTVLRNRDFNDPNRLFTATVRSCPDSAYAHHWMGAELRDAGNAAGAEQSQRRSLAIAPHFGDARAELGLALLMQGRNDEAQRELEQAVRARSGDWVARSNLAMLYSQAGRHDEAIAMLADLVRDQPGNIEMKGNHATALLEAGRVQEASDAFREVALRHPLSAVGPNGAGALLAREGRWEEATVWFQEAVRREPANANAIYNLAQGLARSGRVSEALAVVDDAERRGASDEAIRSLRPGLAAAAGSGR